MINKKFTPGEWTAHIGIMEPTFVHIGKEGDYVDGETPVICELHHGIKIRHPDGVGFDFDSSEMRANAYLISAAPEMYEKLKEIQSLFYTFRYCLGRMSYVVMDFCEEATRKISQIRTKWLLLMDKEITEAEQRHNEDPGMNWLGHDCDKREWLKFREVVRAELRKRNEDMA